MDRSLAGRLAIGRQLGPSTRRRAALPWWRPSRALSAVQGLLRAAWGLLLAHRRTRIALLGALIALALLAGGWLWLRNSSLVAVERVHVSGLHGPETAAI